MFFLPWFNEGGKWCREGKTGEVFAEKVTGVTLFSMDQREPSLLAGNKNCQNEDLGMVAAQMSGQQH